jgi:hypothetical protein
MAFRQRLPANKMRKNFWGRTRRDIVALGLVLLNMKSPEQDPAVVGYPKKGSVS